MLQYWFLLFLFSRTVNCEEIIRFVNIKPNGENLQGDVEIYYNELWRPLCSRMWSIQAANAICKTIGFSQGAVAIDFNQLTGQPKRRNYYYLFLGLGCGGDESNVQECPNWNQNVMDIKNCAHGIAIAVCKR